MESNFFSQCFNKNDKRWALATKMDKIYRSVKPWDREKNPEGPTGTLSQRRIKKMMVVLEQIEEHLAEYLREKELP